uniref:Uncharacterized protein n=1 Tax=Gossypium raimondii TaxID=29730 RepID=A0A0D2VFX6_GOSRA|nr:hypothetical protein B456_013G194600 [Gossypium raimondii]
MKSIQANNTFFLPCINSSNPRKSELLFPSYPYLVCFNAKVLVTKKLIAGSSLRSQQFAPLLKHKRCVSGSPWKSIEKAIGNFGKKQSIEDVLRQQIEKQDYYDEGSGQNPPRGGGGGSSSGGDGFGESEDEGLSGILDETVQVIVATLGFIFLFFEKLTEKKEYDKFWLEKAIITTPTWYDSPDKYRRVLNSYIEYDDEDESDYDD